MHACAYLVGSRAAFGSIAFASFATCAGDGRTCVRSSHDAQNDTGLKGRTWDRAHWAAWDKGYKAFVLNRGF